MSSERGWHANDDHIALNDAVKGAGRSKSITPRQRLDHAGSKVLKVVHLPVDALHLHRVNIETHDRQPALMKGVRKRQTDISQANYADGH